MDPVLAAPIGGLVGLLLYVGIRLGFFAPRSAAALVALMGPSGVAERALLLAALFTCSVWFILRAASG